MAITTTSLDASVARIIETGPPAAFCALPTIIFGSIDGRAHPARMGGAV